MSKNENLQLINPQQEIGQIKKHPLLKILEKMSPKLAEMLDTEYYKWLFGNIIHTNLDNFINGSPVIYPKNPKKEQLLWKNYSLSKQFELVKVLSYLVENFTFDKEFVSKSEVQKFFEAACQNTPIKVYIEFRKKYEISQEERRLKSALLDVQTLIVGAKSDGKPQYTFTISILHESKEHSYTVVVKPLDY